VVQLLVQLDVLPSTILQKVVKHVVCDEEDLEHEVEWVEGYSGLQNCPNVCMFIKDLIIVTQ